MKIEDLKNNINIRAYVLYVYHRFKTSGQMAHAETYMKRVPEDIQRMENLRGKLHSKAVKFLKDNGFNEKEIHIFLEDECEKEIKLVSGNSRNGEASCGCCRVNVDGWEEHESSELHKILKDEVYFLHTLHVRMQKKFELDNMTIGEQGDSIKANEVKRK